MELINTEKYGTENRDFEIHTYRDGNSNMLIIEPSEIIKGRSVRLSNLSSTVPIKGELNLKLHEYEGYESALAAVKQSLIIYSYSEGNF